MKNNEVWFKAKLYGWGWRPSSWQGWIVFLLYLIAIVQYAVNIDSHSHSVSDSLIKFSIPFIVNTIFLLIICYAKGEKPYWRWGK